MVVIQCPHCEEEVELDDDAFGEFQCPHCEGEFEWGEKPKARVKESVYSEPMNDLLNANSYLVRKKLSKILGGEFHIYTDDDQDVLIGYSKQKALKFLEDIRVFSDESQSNPILNIKGRRTLDHSTRREAVEALYEDEGKYDFTDSNTGESLGGIYLTYKYRFGYGRSYALYNVYGPDDQVYGDIKIKEPGMIHRLIPFASLAFPQVQVFSMNVQGQPSITFTQKRNTIMRKITVQIPDGNQLDRRVILGAAMIIIAIEGKQKYRVPLIT